MQTKSHFRPSRARGQSFLKDRSVIGRIVTAIDPRTEDVLVEIGAGAGQLTGPLLRTGPKLVLAVEPEGVLANRLNKIEGTDHLEILQQDYLEMNLSAELSCRELGRVRVVGNLPYSAASPILLKLLTESQHIIDLTLMFQLEVAERLVAKPGTKAYGFLTVMAQQATHPQILFTIPPRAFRPQPKVHSALVRLDFRPEDEAPVAEPAIFQALVKSLFAHRRKNISNNVKRLQSDHLDEPTVRSALARLDIDPSRRAETLSVEEFAALSRFCASRQ
jgi:16S rRNA (adenine1518-N6/adenine1519-N6)-dimethyltransferase